MVLTGGELTLDQLDLQYDPYTKMYQAPFQVKANGGVLIVDDFGRQRVPPRDLLNRWIVPLEKRIDFLTLHTGGKFPVPFDCLLIISPPTSSRRELVEEAFLRRIHYKITVEGPDPEEYADIFQRMLRRAGDRVHDPRPCADLPRLVRRPCASRRAAAIRATSSTTWWTSPGSTRCRRPLSVDWWTGPAAPTSWTTRGPRDADLGSGEPTAEGLRPPRSRPSLLRAARPARAGEPPAPAAAAASCWSGIGRRCWA